MGKWWLGPVLLGVAFTAPALAQTSSTPGTREGISRFTWTGPALQTPSVSPVSVELNWRFSTHLGEPVRELVGRYGVGWGLISTATILHAPVCTDYGVMPGSQPRTLRSNDLPPEAWQRALENVELLSASRFRLHFGTISGVTGRLYMDVQADTLERAETGSAALSVPESPAWGRLFRVASGAQPAPDDPWLDDTRARAVFARGATVRYAEMIDARFDVSPVRTVYEEHLKATCQTKGRPQAAEATPEQSKDADASQEFNSQPRRAEPATEAKAPAESRPMLDISALGGPGQSTAPIVSGQVVDSTGGGPTASTSGAGGNEIRASMMLLIDASGSMQGSRIAEAKRAARDAVRRAASVPGSEFSVASFSGECAQPQISVLPFTTDPQKADRFIQSINASGGTPLGPAVSHVNRFMDKNRSTSSRTQIIILLADGADSCNDVSDQVARLKSEGILFRHETIGLETDAKTSEQLQQVASASGGAYHHAARTEELAETFKAATDNIQLLDMLGDFGKTNSKRPDPSSHGGVNWSILGDSSK